ncbi:MAG TPA: LacI family DNA-binding transcriptional regulator [Caulobacteraceae bacterium]|jgi:LacI family transcriptional regulator
MKVTLHQVAARAGVSIATASRALNGLAVSAPAQNRVRQAVADLGYVANEAARSLRSDRTLTMGLIFFDLRNNLGIELIDALSETIEAGGYSLLVASARADKRRYDVLMRRFLERRVDALFCINPRGGAENLPLYADAGTPVIALFAAGSAFANLPLVTPSFSESAAALAADLASLGHRRVALVVHEAKSPPLLGIADALKGGGLAVDWVEASEAGGMREAAAQLHALNPGPTAVVAIDVHARGLLAAGVRAPETLSVVAISEIGVDAKNRKLGLSALVIDPHRMGKAAASAMLAWLAGSKPAERVLVQAASWEPRESVGPAALAAERAV